MGLFAARCCKFRPDPFWRTADDGRGFDPAGGQPSARGGFGLPGIRERAEAMHATFELARVTGGGTRLEVFVPHV